MNESPNKRAVIVGFFIFLGLAFLIAGVLIIGNLRNTFTTKLHVVAVFDDVNGLQKGNNIWFSGVKIGTIKTVNFRGQSSVKVTLSINESARQFIRKDAKVKISTDGLIGNKILVIYGGSYLSEAVNEGDTLMVEKLTSTEDMMNTLQENNKNFLAITSDLKTISHKLANGSGSIGRMLNDEGLYQDLSATAASLKAASVRAELLMSSLSTFGSGLNKKGTLANSLVTDTSIFNSLKASVLKLGQAGDSAALLINNLKQASGNTKTPLGVMLHDEEAGAHLKTILQNLARGSQKLDEDLEGLQHSFLLRKYFRKKEKAK